MMRPLLSPPARLKARNSFSLSEKHGFFPLSSLSAAHESPSTPILSLSLNRFILHTNIIAHVNVHVYETMYKIFLLCERKRRKFNNNNNNNNRILSIFVVFPSLPFLSRTRRRISFLPRRTVSGRRINFVYVTGMS